MIQIQARTASQTVHGIFSKAPIFHATRLDLHAAGRHIGTSYFLWCPIFRHLPAFTLKWETKGKKYTISKSEDSVHGW